MAIPPVDEDGEIIEPDEELDEDTATLHAECLVLLQMLLDFKPSLATELGIADRIKDTGANIASVEVIWRGELQRRFFQIPKICADFQKLSLSKNQNDLNEAQKLDNILQKVHNAMFVESNPSPVKFAAKLMNLCDDAVRLPLVKVTEETKSIVKKALVSAELI